MLDTIGLFRTASALAEHALKRHSVVAQNIAQADTPGYLARDVTPFRAADSDTHLPLRNTRSGHLTSPDEGGTAAVARIDREAIADPNGNSVTLEREMVRTAELRHQHDMAMAVYKSALGILRTSLGGPR